MSQSRVPLLKVAVKVHAVLIVVPPLVANAPKALSVGSSGRKVGCGMTVAQRAVPPVSRITSKRRSAPAARRSAAT